MVYLRFYLYHFVIKTILGFIRSAFSQFAFTNSGNAVFRLLRLLGLIVFIYILPVSSHSAVFNIPPGDVGVLIDAINSSNSNGQSDTINLAIGSTYTLSPTNDARIPFLENGFNGLPSVTSEISINGNGSQIVGGASNIPCDGFGVEFRIFHVGSEGDLTLNDTTVSQLQD